METKKATCGLIGISLGGLAMLLALVHFYAGPFSPTPTLEQAVGQKAAAIRKAAVAALKGESVETAPAPPRFDADRITQLAVAVMGGLAIILAVIGFARHEGRRAVIGAASLGLFAVSFQFLTIALGVLVFAILVAGTLASFGAS